jgi:hypothetical protein
VFLSGSRFWMRPRHCSMGVTAAWNLFRVSTQVLATDYDDAAVKSLPS